MNPKSILSALFYLRRTRIRKNTNNEAINLCANLKKKKATTAFSSVCEFVSDIFLEPKDRL